MTRGNHRLVVAVANTKGGTSKTTTAVFLAHALHERGRRVLLIDADKQASAAEWSRMAGGFPFQVLPVVSRTLYAKVDEYAASGIDTIVIDTPPLEEGTGVVLGAARAASVVLAPVAPTPIEYTRLPRVADLARDAGVEFRPDRRAVPFAALLTRTVAGTLAARDWRDQAEEDGYWCLKSEIRFRQQFAQAFGSPVRDANETAYGDVAEELLSKEGLA